MNDLLKPQYTLTVDCSCESGCDDCEHTGLIKVCPRCEFLECLCTDDEDGFEPDNDRSLWLVR